MTQEDAARLPGVCDRTFRRQIDRYETDGMDALLDKRLTQHSHKRAPVDEVIGLVVFVGWANVLLPTDYSAWAERTGNGAAGVVGLGETCGAGKIRVSAQGAGTGIR